MATKGSKKFTDSITGLFKKETPQDRMREEQQQLAQNRSREENMIFKLNSINFYDPANKLSPEYIKEKKYDSIVRYAASELKHPPIISQDIETLDKYIEFAIDALDVAVKEGLENAAEWSCVALHSAVTTLRTEVSGIDADFADALLESKLNYAKNLQIIIRTSIEHDRTKRDLALQQKRQKKKRAELDELKAEYNAKVSTVEGARAQAEISEYANNPSMMSDAAKELKDMLYALHRMKGECTQLEVDIDTKHAVVLDKLSVIESTRNRLATPPTVSDPRLQEKIKQANDLYIESLLKQLNAVAENTRAFDQFISKMTSLKEHTVFVDQAVAAQNEINAMRMEEQEKLRRAKDLNAKMRRQLDEKNMLELENKRLETELEAMKVEELNLQQEEEEEEEYEVEEIFVME